jgi:Zn-dependent protease
MKSAHGLGQIFKVRVRVHYTWLVALALITAIVVTQFPEIFSLWQRIVFGLVTGLLLFVAVSLRQLAVVLLAISRGLSVRRLTLFVFGGVFQSSAESTRPVLERLVAVAGLVANLLMAGVFYGIYIGFVVAGSEIAAGLTQWLGFIYFMLALFHFIPAYPLDGGRLLASYLWPATGNYYRATKILSWVGWAIGLFLFGGGISLAVLGRQWFFGLLLILVGWSLVSGAGLSRRQAEFYAGLEGFNAGHMISKEYRFITPDLNIRNLVRDRVLVTGERYFVVKDGAKWEGVVTLHRLKSVPRRRWDSTAVRQVMVPVSRVKVARVEQSAVSLLEQMDDLRVSELPIVDGDEVVGIVTRDSLLRLVRSRAELGV